MPIDFRGEPRLAAVWAAVDGGLAGFVPHDEALLATLFCGPPTEDARSPKYLLAVTTAYLRLLRIDVDQTDGPLTAAGHYAQIDIARLQRGEDGGGAELGWVLVDGSAPETHVVDERLDGFAAAWSAALRHAQPMAELMDLGLLKGGEEFIKVKRLLRPGQESGYDDLVSSLRRLGELRATVLDPAGFVLHRHDILERCAPGDGTPPDEPWRAAPASPPAWAADPWGRHEHRWWDGAGWTEHVSTGGQASIDPPPV